MTTKLISGVTFRDGASFDSQAIIEVRTTEVHHAQIPKLVDASVDLLAALQKTLCYLEADADDDTERTDHAEARAAIAKATEGSV